MRQLCGMRLSKVRVKTESGAASYFTPMATGYYKTFGEEILRRICSGAVPNDSGEFHETGRQYLFSGLPK